MIDELKAFLSAIKSISLGYSELNFFKPQDLEVGQIGYGLYLDGTSLINGNSGDWNSNWIVIANDSFGDPIIVDVKSKDLPVYSAMHGEGSWEPFLIADSLITFNEIIEILGKLSYKRTNPVEIEQNPISEMEIDEVLNKIEVLNPNSDIEFWASFLG